MTSEKSDGKAWTRRNIRPVVEHWRWQMVTQTVNCIVFIGLFVVGLTCATDVREFCDGADKETATYSHRNLSRIPNNIPTTTTHLDLSDNRLAFVSNNSFYNLKTLRELDLSCNNITKLDFKSFYGLFNLCLLNLSRNPMSSKSFAPSVFSYIQNLQVLYMENIDGNFPDKAMSKLTELRQLFVFPKKGITLGSGFSSLVKLEEFHIRGGIVKYIQNTTFSAFENLPVKTLSCKDCLLEKLDIAAFVPFKHLKVLDLSHNRRLGLPNALRALYGLQNRNMTSIILQEVSFIQVFFSYRNFILEEKDGEFLRTICVETLDLGNNFILYLSSSFFALFRHPKCLKWLSIRNHNILSFNTGVLAILLFTELEHLDARGSVQIPSGSTSTFAISNHVHQSYAYQRTGLREKRSPKISPKILKTGVIISLPPNLTYVDASHTVSEFGIKVNFTHTKRLRFVDLSNNGIHNCHLPGNETSGVEVLNISRIDCSVMPPGIFRGFPNLQILEIAGIGLATGLLADTSGVLLKHQVNLRLLNMADNGLTILHDNLFSSLKQLRTLILANNKLLRLSSTVRHLETLEHIDLSYNSLTHLTQADRLWMESTSENCGLTVRLDGNPLSCSCSTVNFVQWIIETQVKILNRDKLTCTLTNGSLVEVVTLKESLKNFRVQCVSKFWLTFAVTAGSVTCAMLLISVIGYRYRYNIKYWFLTKCRSGYKYETVDTDYQYDAFIGYNHHDYRWVCHTLRGFLEETNQYRVNLHHRDFPVGESIQQNIVDAVNSSRKIILVVSRYFIACDWSEFEIQMAGMRMVQGGRVNVVVVILLEDIPVREMPRSLINLWKHVTFLLWTDDPADVDLFWERLKNAMA